MFQHILRRCVLPLAMVFVACRLTGAADEPAPRPNVVFFYADDLGYGDLACYGSDKAQSPTLDALADAGTRFTQFYVSHCVCSPTRCSAITGHYPSRHRIFGHIAHFDANRKRNMPDWLDVEAPSLPRALQEAGYRTAMIGKWHLGGGSGSTWMSDRIVINHPDAPAVERYGFHHARTIFGNSATWKGTAPWPTTHDVYPYADEEFSTWSSRLVADETVAFLRNHARGAFREHPFYVNAWFHDVHVPMRPTAEMRRPFSDLPEKEQVHYAMIRYMDEQIGRVLDVLDELGLSDKTLVLFSSDNGAAKDRGGSNAPLRDWKHGLYEGGIRVPLIVRWPGRVSAGRVDEDSVLNIVDLVPTIARLADAQMPAGYRSDGTDISDVLYGKPLRSERALMWHHPHAGSRSPSLAIRRRNWKLLCEPDGSRMELYDLQADVAESQNLAAAEPEIAAELFQELQQWDVLRAGDPN